jgi:hypothetical protein
MNENGFTTILHSTMIGKDEISGGVRTGERGQDVARSESQPTANKRLDGTVLQAQRAFQMKLLEALTPLSCIQEQFTGGFHHSLSHTNATTSDLQIEPPPIFESIETNSRYKDVSELIFLFGKHDSDSSSSDDGDIPSDGGTLCQLKCTHIFCKLENKHDCDDQL